MPEPRTLDEHAAAIQAAINAAADDGYFLDDGDAGILRLDLNRWGQYQPTAWVEITVPER